MVQVVQVVQGLGVAKARTGGSGRMAPLGEKFKVLRVAAGMTLQEVTDALGLADGHVAAIETGKFRNPRVDLAARLARYYGADLGELLRDGPLRGPSPESLAIVRLFEEQLTPAQRRLMVQYARLLAEYQQAGHDGAVSDSRPAAVAQRRKAGVGTREARKTTRGRTP